MLFALVAGVSAGNARTEFVRWTHSDPSTVDEFRIYVAPGDVGFDPANAAVVMAGLPTPTAGVYEYGITVPDGDTVWATVAAANAAGEGPLASPQLRSAPVAPTTTTTTSTSTTTTTTTSPSPTSVPIGTAPTVGSITTITGPGVGWSLTIQGDLNGDGQADLIWQNGSERQLWVMNGSQVVSREPLLRVSTSRWRLIGAGDFDGDGKDELLWRHRKKKHYVMWFMDGSQQVSSAHVGFSSKWAIRGIGDMDGDGRDDLLLRKRSKKSNTKYDYRAVSMDGAAPIGSTLIAKVHKSFSAVSVGDFDGDGHVDILWRDNRNANFQVWLIRDRTVVGGATLDTTSLSVEHIADLDGDGSDDIIWRDSSTDDYWASMMNGVVEREMAFLSASRTPYVLDEVADLDSNGQGDLVWTDGGTSFEVWTHQP